MHLFGYRRTNAGTAQRRLKRKRVVVCCAIGISLVLVPLAVWRGVPYCRVEMAIHSFASNPSQAGANKLTGLLDECVPTRGQAARILKLLLWPKVNVRSGYAIGRKPTISTTLPCYLHFDTALRCHVNVRAGGLPRPTYGASIQLSTEPEVLISPVAPDRPGKFRMDVEYHYLLSPPPRGQFYSTNPIGRFLRGLLTRIKIEPWLPPPQKKWYQVRFRVPVEIEVVAPAQAERVQLLSDPELDRRMKDILRPIWDRAPELAGLWVHGQVLPANVAFRCFLELSDGTRITSSRSKFRGLRGYAGLDLAIGLSLGDFTPLRPGTYDAKFVFESDPNCALDEPTLKSIWNGKLELPIHFTVPGQPNTGR